jgi:hypothetical protein
MAEETGWILSNPSGTLRFSLLLKDSNLTYQVTAPSKDGEETVIVRRSPLGITRKDQDFTRGLSFVSESKIKVIDETYHLLIGKQRDIFNHGIEQTFTFENPDKSKLELVVRAYADGVAFRYRFPGKSKAIYTVTNESTGFIISDSGKAWMLPYAKVDTWAPAYEDEWKNAINIGSSSPDTAGWAFPALFHADNWWIMVTEADASQDFYSAHLEQHCEKGCYRIRMPESDETYGVAPQFPSSTLPWQTPWRTLIIGNSPGDIQESNLVYNLSRSCVLKDISWIRPGRVSWSWWSDGGSPNDYNKLIPFVDLAATMGWEYSLIDLGWHEMKNGNIKQLIDYAKSKGVGIILWYNSGGPHNHVDAWHVGIMDNPIKRKAEMKKLESWGVKGVKVDFMQSDKQYLMKLYEDILRDAAKHHLFVDFHGATIPRGWARTYPNMLTMEAIRGAEQYWDTNFAENAHMFHTIYTFTRNVVGSMDYTPVIFGDAPHKISHKTTNAHELATSVAFESGLQHFIDMPESYLSQPEYVIDFLRTVPVVWDEIKYINGKPGELSIIARRHDKDWYIAGLNGEVKAKSVSVPLSFLGEGNYECLLITDGKVPRSFEGKTLKVVQDSVLSVNMAERGGFAARIRLKK